MEMPSARKAPAWWSSSTEPCPTGCRPSCARGRGKPPTATRLNELRDYGIGAQILAELGVHDMVLLTNAHHTLVGARRLWSLHRRRTANPRYWRHLMARLLIVEARFYDHLNDLLDRRRARAIEAAGHDARGGDGARRARNPGAIAMAAETGRYDGFVAIGVVIRGETYHFEIVANESARGIMALAMDGLAIGNGILTVEDEAQALARAPADREGQGRRGGQGGAGDDGAACPLRRLSLAIRGARLCWRHDPRSHRCGASAGRSDARRGAPRARAGASRIMPHSTAGARRRWPRRRRRSACRRASPASRSTGRWR